MWLLSLKSILVATDLREESLPALRTAARLAPLAGAGLHLLHVVDAPPTPADDLAVRDHFRRAVSDPPELETIQVLRGSPAAVIVDQAERLDADVVILGPHRKADSGELGSTAARVVRTAGCPCLVAATELHLPLRKVVVPIDLSEVAGGALSVALSWASALRPRGGRAQLTALHVAATDAAVAGEAANAEVDRARGRAGGAAHVDARALLVQGGDPTAEILGASSAEHADLLVMGTRGLGGTPSELGSVSTAVARATATPLLLVPPATWEEQDEPLAAG